MSEVVYFDGDYARKGVIEVERGVCDRCKQDANVLTMDGSEGEYERGRLCRPCANAMFDAVPTLLPPEPR